MRTTRAVVIFLSLAVMILFTAQSALGGCDVTQLPPIIGNAPGTKLEGPITVFYKWASDDPAGPAWTADMYWFLRLRKGSQFYSFAGGGEEVVFPTDLYTLVPEIIGDFFINIVIPQLYPPCEPLVDCPDVVLKSYNMLVDWEAPPYPGYISGLYFFIADVVIAVQD